MNAWTSKDIRPLAFLGPAMPHGRNTMRHEKLRIALYSHDTMGIGHMRRNQLIAETFAASSLRPNILMICGAREAGYFDPPPGVDYVTMPSLAKRADGVYQARRLDVELAELTRLRSEILRGTLEAFEPDVLIVDKVPRGAMRELDASLGWLREVNGTRIVLGLRDILDDPQVVAEEWARDDAEHAIRDYYDAMWVYGCREVYDVARRYCFASDIAKKIRYAGYLRRFAETKAEEAGGTDAHLASEDTGEIAACVVGGGQDGGDLAEAFACAPFPSGMAGVIVTGPFMPADARRRIYDTVRVRNDMRVHEFLPDMESLLRRASRVVAMGGYNTVCELLALGKHALIVPRTQPRSEQLLRAQTMHARGLIDYLQPHQLSPIAIGAWLSRPEVTAASRARAFNQLDFDGLRRLPDMLDDLLGQPPASRRVLTNGAIHVA